MMQTALSIRQPWAWLIVNGFKPIENRTWASNYRGPLWIHAGATMTRGDYDACQLFIAGFSDIQLPRFNDFGPGRLERGGFVGAAVMTDCVSESESPWFVGDYGFVLAEAVPKPFRFYRGQLGFFRFKDEP